MFNFNLPSSSEQGKPMRLKCITCEALTRLVYLCAAESKHKIDITLVKIGLHDTPKELRRRLQNEIDTAPENGYDAVLLAYGLCGKATDGLVAKEIQLVIPRAHDCITLFLGSRQRYNKQFDQCPGTYWYVLDYLERRDADSTVLSLGSGSIDFDIHSKYEEYVQKYGKDNADYLLETMGAWTQHYTRAVFLDMGLGYIDELEAKTIEQAQQRGWTYERMAGNMVLIRRLLNGDWENDFLVVPPGNQIRMTGAG
ncbi:MAG: DUF1638 domain-containing protein, partial [Chloroflexota bacterium]